MPQENARSLLPLRATSAAIAIRLLDVSLEQCELYWKLETSLYNALQLTKDYAPLHAIGNCVDQEGNVLEEADQIPLQRLRSIYEEHFAKDEQIDRVDEPPSPARAALMNHMGKLANYRSGVWLEDPDFMRRCSELNFAPYDTQKCLLCQTSWTTIELQSTIAELLTLLEDATRATGSSNILMMMNRYRGAIFRMLGEAFSPPSSRPDYMANKSMEVVRETSADLSEGLRAFTELEGPAAKSVADSAADEALDTDFKCLRKLIFDSIRQGGYDIHLQSEKERVESFIQRFHAAKLGREPTLRLIYLARNAYWSDVSPLQMIADLGLDLKLESLLRYLREFVKEHAELGFDLEVSEDALRFRLP